MSVSTIDKVNKDHWAVRGVAGIAGLGAAGVLVYVSATMNFRFGYSMGKTPEDALLYGQFSAAADTLKVLMPFMAAWGFRQRVSPVAWGATVGLIVCMLWGWTGAAGHLASNRLDVTGQRAVKADSYKDLRADKERMVKQLETWTAAVNKPSSAIKAEIEGAKFGKMWTTTTGCTNDVTTRDRREFCQNVAKMEADLGTAMKREEYQRKLEEVTAKLDRATEGENAGKVGATDADPQASLLSRFSAGVIGVPMWQVILAVLGVAVLELGGGLIPFVSLTYMFGVSVQSSRSRVLDLTPIDEPSASSAAAAALAPAAAPLALATLGPGVGSAAGQALLPQPVALAITEATAVENPPPDKPAGSLKATPAPEDDRPINPFLGAPLPGSEGVLRAIGFPLDGRPPGPQRTKKTVNDEVDDFITVCQCLGGDLVDKPIARTDIGRLYRMYALANYREMVELDPFLQVMERRKSRGVEFGKMRYDESKPDNKRLSFRIARRTFRAAPKEVGGSRVVPSLAAPANDVAPPKEPLRIVPRAPRFSDTERWSIAEARAVKAEFRGLSKKQRGSRMHKRAA